MDLNWYFIDITRAVIDVDEGFIKAVNTYMGSDVGSF